MHDKKLEEIVEILRSTSRNLEVMSKNLDRLAEVLIVEDTIRGAMQ